MATGFKGEPVAFLQRNGDVTNRNSHRFSLAHTSGDNAVLWDLDATLGRLFTCLVTNTLHERSEL